MRRAAHKRASTKEAGCVSAPSWTNRSTARTQQIDLQRAIDVHISDEAVRYMH